MLLNECLYDTNSNDSKTREVAKDKNGKNKNNIPYTKITDSMYWVDDANSKYYNQLVNIEKVEKDWETAEHLIEYKTQYEYLIEIKTNPNNIPKKGSAIFLHCTNNTPTAGCISINSKAMKEIIENISKETQIIRCKERNKIDLCKMKYT